MMLLRRLFHRAGNENRELHGLAAAPDQVDQDAIRVRMETEVTRGKVRRAEQAAAEAAKTPPAGSKV